jgi:carbamoyl-phosphate synthase large subunit
VSKVCNIQMAGIATNLMLGSKISKLGLQNRAIPHFGVKESVFPFQMFPEVDPVLGPEMRSTGEVLGMADSFGLAFFKAEQAAKSTLPEKGVVLMSVARNERTPDVVKIAQAFRDLGFTIKATEGTYNYLSANGIESGQILKLHEGRPNILDAIANKEIQLVINTPTGKASQYDDSYIRKAAVKHKLPYITTLAAASAAAKGINAVRKGKGTVTSLQEYHKNIK